MATYIGKRIVPVHCGKWDMTKAYEMLSIVLEETSGDSYIARRAVPVGTAITDTHYWMLHSLYSQQIKDMLDQLAATEQRIVADNDATAAEIRNDNDQTETEIRNDNAATKEYLDGKEAALTETVENARTAMTNQKNSFDQTAASLNTRMDAVLAAGTGTGETEILDARVDTEGNAFDSLGSHIRSVSERSNSALNSRLNFLVLEQGSITAIGANAGEDQDASDRVRTVTKIEYPVHIDLSNTDYLVNTYNIYNKTTGAFIPPAVSPQGNSQKIIDIVPESGTYVRITFKHANGNDFTPGDLQPDLTMCNFETRIKSLETQTDKLQNQTDGIQVVVSTNDNAIFTTGYFIDTSQGNVGSVVDVTPISNAFTACFISQCKAGDIYTITGTGGSSARLWCFLDSNYTRLSGKTAAANASATDLQLIADQSGYFICNVLIANPYSAVKTTVGDMTFDDIKDSFRQIDSELDEINGKLDNVTHITNPHLLAWRMGVFDANGPQSYTQGILPTDRFFTVVKLKKGSTVSKKSEVARGRNLSFGYKLSESDETLSGYTANAGSSITVTQDCIAYIGIRYANPVEALKNDEILDTYDFSLDVIDYRSRYNRSQGVDGRYYGFPCPEIYYEGQHTDTTGWNNRMSSIQAVYDAFDVLCDASDGYLTRTQDYGVAYMGNADNALYDADSEWHMYGYTAKPASMATGIKIALTCCVHGNEKMSVYALHYLMYDLVYNSTKNPILSYLKSNCTIRFIPICNPYGFMKENPSRVNENGVNINRNFPTYNWSEWESGEGTLNYKGTSAGSEIQTQLIMKFFRDNYDSIFSVDIHTDGADTQARDQISAFMITVPDTTDENYQIQHDFLLPGMSYTRRLKPWMNEKYNAGLPYEYAWGSATEMPHYPSVPEWIRQAVGTPGLCYEVLAGGSNGYIGPNLTVYGADTIKFAAEELGMFLTTIVAHCKDLKG